MSRLNKELGKGYFKWDEYQGNALQSWNNQKTAGSPALMMHSE